MTHHIKANMDFIELQLKSCTYIFDLNISTMVLAKMEEVR